MLAIKNTFIDLVDVEQEDEIRSLSRSASDSSLSRRSYAWSTSSLQSDASAGYSAGSSHLSQQDLMLQSNDSHVPAVSYTDLHVQSAGSFDSYSLEGGTNSFEVSSDSARQSDHPAPAQGTLSALVESLLYETGLPLHTLMQLEESGILGQIPRNEEDQISSIGSMKEHFEGTCSPCIFWFRGECSNSLLCRWCHFRHEGQKSRRYKPNKRVRIARRAQLGRLNSEEPSGLES